jgi:hypothetical protein
VAEAEPKHEVSRSEIAKALEQWETDAVANGWDKRDDKERFLDAADYLIHTIRLARGEGSPEQKDA